MSWCHYTFFQAIWNWSFEPSFHFQHRQLRHQRRLAHFQSDQEKYIPVHLVLGEAGGYFAKSPSSKPHSLETDWPNRDQLWLNGKFKPGFLLKCLPNLWHLWKKDESKSMWVHVHTHKRTQTYIHTHIAHAHIYTYMYTNTTPTHSVHTHMHTQFSPKEPKISYEY